MIIVELSDAERLDWIESDAAHLNILKAHEPDGELTLRDFIDYMASESA